jgi:hypothetical protein
MDLKTLNEYPVEPMAPEQSQFMLTIMFAEPAVLDAAWEGAKTNFGPAVMLKRIPERMQIDVKVLIWASDSITSPGIAVLWAYTIFRLAQKHGDKLSWDDFIYAFPNGFPTERSMQQAWEDQKGEGGFNLLDQAETWK